MNIKQCLIKINQQTFALNKKKMVFPFLCLRINIDPRNHNPTITEKMGGAYEIMNFPQHTLPKPSNDKAHTNNSEPSRCSLVKMLCT